MHEMVWDGMQWRLEEPDRPERLAGWEIDLLMQANRDDLKVNSTRFVKRAPLGMHLTRNDGFRMVK